MLPIHKRWRSEFNKKEALWKRSISVSHSIFCNCPDYRLHFHPKCHSMAEGAGGDLGGVSPGEGISFATEEDIGGAGDHGDTDEAEPGW
ncbi:ORF2 [Grizzly bear anellovirus 4]|nr:ORF2 [Grizzly bear anellovirus 4]